MNIGKIMEKIASPCNFFLTIILYGEKLTKNVPMSESLRNFLFGANAAMKVRIFFGKKKWGKFFN